MSFDYFVHIEVRDSPGELEDSDGALHSAQSEIRRWIDDHPVLGSLDSSRSVRLGLLGFNLKTVVVGYGSPSRVGELDVDLRELVHLIARVAPGSYGMLYMIDMNYETDWTVLVVRRGEVFEASDPWFSPIIPMIEDPHGPEPITDETN